MPLLEANPDGEIIQVPNGAQDEFTLACSWPGVESNATLTYSVEWMINDDLVDQVTSKTIRKGVDGINWFCDDKIGAFSLRN